MLLFLPQTNFYFTVQTEVCFQTSCWFKGAADLASIRISSNQTVSTLTRGKLIPPEQPPVGRMPAEGLSYLGHVRSRREARGLPHERTGRVL